MLTRRNMLAGLGAAALAMRAGRGAVAATPVPVPLWPDLPPGGGGPLGPLLRSPGGGISNLPAPYFEVFAPQQPNGMGVLVAAGGGYRSIQIGAEAYSAARWLNERGITAFVLAYRLPGEGWKAGPLAPLQDAQRAMRMIRARAKDYGVDSARLGVLGFSAGGHLAGMTAVRFAFQSYEPADAADEVSARPDFAALVYPVITLEAPYDNTSTRRVLVGDNPSAEQSRQWSVQTYVGRGCPPVFMVQAVDDPITKLANTQIMKAACESAGVPVEVHQLPSGGHGFSMGRRGTPTGEWAPHFDRWLARGAAPLLVSGPANSLDVAGTVE